MTGATAPRRAVVGLATAAVLAALAFAQPQSAAPDPAQDASQEEPPRATAEREGEAERGRLGTERLRAMLERRLKETASRMERERTNQRMLQRALDRLDAGDAPREVFGELRRSHARAEQARNAGAPPAPEATDRPAPSGDHKSEVRRRRLLEALDEHMPALAERFEALIAQDPERARVLLDRLGAPFREALELRERDPELAALKIQEMRSNLEMHRAARELREAAEAADQAAQREARRELVDAVRQSFDAHLAVARAEVERLEQRLERLRGDIERREQQRRLLIDAQLRRFDELSTTADAEGEAGG